MYQRGNYGEERYEKVEFQRKVREVFQSLQNPNTTSTHTPWHVLDARGSPAELHEEIKKIALDVIHSVRDREVASLW